MKRILLVVTVIILVFSLTGCDSEPKKETIVSSSVSEGSYLLFQTTDVNDYLSFLENFDESKYEIVNIDTFLYERATTYSDDYFMVTYRKIQ